MVDDVVVAVLPPVAFEAVVGDAAPPALVPLNINFNFYLTT